MYGRSGLVISREQCLRYDAGLALRMYMWESREDVHATSRLPLLSPPYHTIAALQLVSPRVDPPLSVPSSTPPPSHLRVSEVQRFDIPVQCS